MKIIEKKIYKILRDEQNDLSNVFSYLEEEGVTLLGENLVIDLLQMEELALEEAIDFLPIARKYKERKKSFVIVTNNLDIEDVPEELAVVPSLVEAEDLIQMEEIERELGF